MFHGQFWYVHWYLWVFVTGYGLYLCTFFGLTRICSVIIFIFVFIDFTPVLIGVGLLSVGSSSTQHTESLPPQDRIILTKMKKSKRIYYIFFVFLLVHTCMCFCVCVCERECTHWIQVVVCRYVQMAYLCILVLLMLGKNALHCD